LHAVASVAGYACQAPNVDDDSVDRTIIARGWVDPEAVHYSPRIDVQVKSVSRGALTRGAKRLKDELRKENYDELRPENPLSPRLLVVFLLPRDRRRRLSQGDRQMVVRYAAYYISLCGQRARGDVRHSVTVEVPRKNLFSVRNLRRLMSQASRGWR